MSKKFLSKNTDSASIEDEFQQERDAARKKFSEQDRKDFWKNFDQENTHPKRNSEKSARRFEVNNKDVANRPSKGKSFDKKDFKPKHKDGDAADKGSFRAKDKDFGAKREFGKKEFDRPDKRDFRSKDRDFGGKPEFGNKADRGDKKEFHSRDRDFGGKREFGNRADRGDRKEFHSKDRDFGGQREFGNRADRGDKKDFSSKDRDFGGKREFGNRADRGDRKDFKSKDRDFGGKREFSNKDRGDKKDFKSKDRDFKGKDNGAAKDRPFKRANKRPEDAFKEHFDYEHPQAKAYDTQGNKGVTTEQQTPSVATETMPLNKYIAHCGVCSRRDAVELIKEGKVTVNSNVVTEPGMKINTGDIVQMEGKELKVQKNLVYVLLNKPKGFITTTDDPKGRKTVMDIFGDNISERVFPVGRLDRNTTGLLLLTNDGEVAQQLSHPKYENRKIYQVTLNKNVAKTDFEQILAGLELEDGVTKVDQLAYLENKNEIGIEIHSGKNRIVRRIFEHLGYEVEKLDRVMYAGLTKKNLKRGQWRFLTKQEVINLKHLKR